MSHLLIELSSRFPSATDPEPEGWRYCRRIGAWQPEPNTAVAGRSLPRRPTSKKCDHETGEDMKGA